MKLYESMKRALSVLLTLCVVLSCVPATAFAAAEDGLCEHHAEHIDCGYDPAVSGSECTYITNGCQDCMAALTEDEDSTPPTSDPVGDEDSNPDSNDPVGDEDSNPDSNDSVGDGSPVPPTKDPAEDEDSTPDPNTPAEDETPVPPTNDPAEDEDSNPDSNDSVGDGSPVPETDPEDGGTGNPSPTQCICVTACGGDNGIDPGCTVCLEDFWQCTHFVPTCTCVEACTEAEPNVWCAVCGVRGAEACEGTDTAAAYAVATVDGYGYNTLQEAINAAVNGGTVVLIANVTGTGDFTVPESASVTLDLNGKYITCNSITVDATAQLTIMSTNTIGVNMISSKQVVNNGALTVANCSIEASVNDANGVENYGMLTVQDGASICGYGNSSGVVNYGTLTVEGGAIQGSGYGVENMTDTEDSTKGGTVNVSGGIIRNGVLNQSACTLNVSGGSITAGIDGAVHNEEGGIVIATGGEIQQVENYGTMTVAGNCQINAEDGAESGLVFNGDTGTLYVQGGSIYCLYPVGREPSGLGVRNRGGTVVMSGGDIRAKYEFKNEEDGSIKVTGGEFTDGALWTEGIGVGGILGAIDGKNCAVYDEDGPVEVTGAEVAGTGLKIKVCTHTTESYEIEENTHTLDCPFCYTTAESEPHDYTQSDPQGKCVCGSVAEAKVTADDTTTYYYSLEAGITAAKQAANSTLTLLTNVEGGYAIDSGTFTLDLNGKTIKASSSAAITVSGANLTIQDSATGGTIDATTDFNITGGTVALKGGNFPSGIVVSGGKSLNNLLYKDDSVEYAYYKDGVKTILEDTVTELAGNMVTVAKVCKHLNAEYTINIYQYQHESTHSFVCGDCNTQEDDIPHSYENKDGKMICICTSVAQAMITVNDSEPAYRAFLTRAIIDAAEMTKPTVTLLVDVEGECQTIGGEIILDLNGKTITGHFTNNEDSILTIQDSSKDGNGKITGGENQLAVTNDPGAQLYVNGGTITSTETCLLNMGTLTVDGGVITDGEVGLHNKKGTVTVKSGSITGSVYAVSNEDDTESDTDGVTVTGGTIDATTDFVGDITNIKLSGGTFPDGIAVNEGKSLSSLLVSGYAYYIGDAMQSVADNADSLAAPDSAVTVDKVCDHPTEKREYAIDTDDNYKHYFQCKKCSTTSDSEDHVYDENTGKCTLCPFQAQAKVTVEGSEPVYYDTLTNAIDAAETMTGTDVTVTLLTNVTGFYTVEKGTFTLDLNGNTITRSTSGVTITVQKDATLTIKGSGEIIGNPSNSTSVGVDNYGNLTIDGAKITSSNGIGVYNDSAVLTVKSGSTISGSVSGVQNYGDADNPATVTVEGGTISSDRCGLNNSRGTVTVKTGGAITGGTYGVNNYKGTLSLEGGTITGNGENGIGVKNEEGTVTVTAGTINAPTDFNITDGKVTLTGGTFTDGIKVNEGKTLKEILGTNCAYYIGDDQQNVDSGESSLGSSGSNVTVGCAHSTGKYINIQTDTHTFDCDNTNCDMTRVEAHSPTYSVSTDGATITKTCELCKATLGTATISCAGGDYNGQQYTANVEDDGDLDGKTWTITYIEVKDDPEQNTTLPEAPTNAGVYTASITHEGVTATATFEITAAELEAKPYDPNGTFEPENGLATGTYGDKLSDLTVLYLKAELNGTKIPGTWKVTGDTYPNAGDEGPVTVTFTPDTSLNAANYQSLTTEIPMRIDQAFASRLLATNADQEIRYGDGDFTEPTFTDTVFPENHEKRNVTGTLTYTITDTANGAMAVTNGKAEDVKASLAMLNKGAEVEVEWTFTPAEPPANYYGTREGTFTVTAKGAPIDFTVGKDPASPENAIKNLTDSTEYGKTWNERIELITESIIAKDADGNTLEGTYTIVPYKGALTDRPDVGDHNYAVKFTGGGYTDVTVFTGTLKVTPKPITVTADDVIVPLNAVVDVKQFTYTVTGLCSGDALITEPVLTTSTPPVTSTEMNFAIIFATKANAGDNYTIKHVDGWLKVRGQRTITVVPTANGTVTVSHTSAIEGTPVTITATPNSGYRLSTLVVTDESGNSLNLSRDMDGNYVFTMPFSNVTVKATFASIYAGIADPTNPKTGDDFHLVLWSSMAMISLLGLAMMTRKKDKHQR